MAFVLFCSTKAKDRSYLAYANSFVDVSILLRVAPAFVSS